MFKQKNIKFVKLSSRILRYPATLLFLVLYMFTTSCTTKTVTPTKPNEPPTIKFSQFDNVVLKNIRFGTECVDSDSNQQAARKIEENLTSCMRLLFPKLELEDNKKITKKPNQLIVEPQVTELKFICSAARFWLGPLAGSSTVNIKVTFFNDFGEVVAEPVFQTSASAQRGAFSCGASDSKMLEEVAEDICGYALFNR